MTFLKNISLCLIPLLLLTACVHDGARSKSHNPIISGAKYSSPEFIRENSLDYDKLAAGDIVYDEPDTKKKRKKLDIDYSEVGVASWYGGNFHGRRTANGAVYDKNHYTAAHRDLLMPSVVRVTNLTNKRSVLVIVNDRGPYAKTANRIIDVSKQAAKDLGMIQSGTAKVRVDYLHDETMKLLQKYPAKQQAKANLMLNQSLQKHMVELNAKASKESMIN